MAKYKWKTRPYRHQVAAVKQAIPKLYETGGFALLMAPRTGKTKTAIDICGIMHQKGDLLRVVVVCPTAVMDVWVKEIQTHYPFRARITVWDKDGRKRHQLPHWQGDFVDFVIVNYEAFQTAGAIVGRTPDLEMEDGTILKGSPLRSSKKGGRYDMRNAFKKWQPDMIILDEMHRIKSPSAQKTRSIYAISWVHNKEIPLVKFRLGLTGTAVTKKKRIFDLYSEWKFINRKSPLVTGKDLADFKDEFSVWTKRNGYPQWLRNKPKTEARLRKLLHNESFAVTREECYDLPPRLPPQLIPVDLEESAPFYDQMAEEMVAKLESGEFTWAKIPLVQRLRLAQITSGIAKTEPTDDYPEGRLVRVGAEKLRALEDYLYDQFEAEEKVVIAGRFLGDLQGIENVCKKLKVPFVRIQGNVSRTDRTLRIAEFNRMEGAGALIAQPATISEGIDLRSAATIIWFSLIDSWVTFSQFEDRIALSERATRYVYFLARGTIDELMYENLQEDGDIAQRITKSPKHLLRNFKING